MLKDLFVNSMQNFDKEYLFVESSLGDFVIEDFDVIIDKNFVTIKGEEWDGCTEERTDFLRGLRIDTDKLTDYEDYSDKGGFFIAIGINNGEYYAHFRN